MARLRIMARDATPTAAHRYIEQLRRANRLLRCYTQNVDGLQNRVTLDTCDHVLELHGKNELKCHRCHLPPAGNLRDLDERLLREGVAWCSRCVDRGTYITHSWVQSLMPSCSRRGRFAGGGSSASSASARLPSARRSMEPRLSGSQRWRFVLPAITRERRFGGLDACNRYLYGDNGRSRSGQIFGR